MPSNRMQRHAAHRALRRRADHHLDAGPGDRAEAPGLLGPGGERVDPAALLDRRGERLWLLTAPGLTGPRPLPWLLRAAWRRAAADPAAAQRPVYVDLARLAAEGPVTADMVLRAITAEESTEHGYLVLLDGLDDAGGAVRAAVAGLPGPLAHAAPASTVVTLSHAEPVPGFHIPAVVLPVAPEEPTSGTGTWDTLGDRLKTQRPWPARLLTQAVDACRSAPEELRWQIIDDLAALPDRRLLFQAAVAAGACDDDGVRRAARTEIESLAGTAPAARDPRWLSRLLTLVPMLDAGGHSDEPSPEVPSAGDVLRRMAATGGPGAAALTLLARRAPETAVLLAEASGDPLDYAAVARAADEPPVLRTILERGRDRPGWPTALIHRAQLDRGVATALLAGRDHDQPPLAAGRWQALRMTRGTAYGRLLDDVLTRPWTWPPYAAPLLASLAQIHPPATPAPIVLAALPGAAAGATLAALLALSIGHLAAGHVTPPAATAAIVAGLAVAGAGLTRRLRQWHATLPGAGETPAPVRREHVLAGVLNLAGRRLTPIQPGRSTDNRLRRACLRAGVPEAEITHLLRALAARHALLADTSAPAVPEQAQHTHDERERQP
ncbi:hypothetical protein Dvina_34865 [Dactylosporangium vinaceum]|uniref:Uncharacterized protein n=1 Tax=Dactylosporangium vinaceum TaxID=53362 RepID=A0ABV5M4B0_9ACTN|nr:hypothetical protein [Dactylosporangium vinaceum]UAB93414.1 hypothetical protein Dvina_34865 [Dactylosporangium vinaceum]